MPLSLLPELPARGPNLLPAPDYDGRSTLPPAKTSHSSPRLKLITFLWTCLGPYSRPYICPFFPRILGTGLAWRTICCNQSSHKYNSPPAGWPHVGELPMGDRLDLCRPSRGLPGSRDGSFDWCERRQPVVRFLSTWGQRLRRPTRTDNSVH